MMNATRTLQLALAGAAVLALAACDKGAKAPEGQVVATVDGKDVTIHELNAEIQSLGPQAQSAPRKLAEQVALARVIERKMLVEEAKKKGIDKTPQYLLTKTRAEEALLVQALQSEIQSKVPPTPREAAQKYVADNPIIFGDRKIFTLDQIQFLRPANIDQLALKDAKTMADVEKILIDANIDYRRAPQQVDTLVVNPALTREIIRLTSQPNAEPFMFADQPAGAPAPVIYINNVTNTQTQPFTGEKAISYAQQVLQRQEIGKRLQDALKKWNDEYKGKIVYGKGYGPPPAPKAAGAPAAAPAAAAAAPAAAPAAPAPAAAN